MVDKYWPRDIAEPEQKVSLLNEPFIFRDTGNAAVLRKWPKARPLHAVIAEMLANVELLLGQLEAGVRVADNQRDLVRQLYVSTQRQREVVRLLYVATRHQVRALAATLELEGLE